MQKSQLAHGFLWLVSGRMAGALVGLVSTAILARLLTPADFGAIAAAYVVLALSNTLFDGAFGVNIVRKKVLRPEDIHTTLSVSLLLGFLLAGLVVLSAPAIQSFFDIEDLKEILFVTSVVIPLKALLSVSSAQLQRAGRFKHWSTIGVLSQVAGYLIFAVPLAFAGYGKWALVAAIVVSSFAEALVACLLARMPLRFGWDSQALRDIQETSLFSGANLMRWVANTSANAVIGHRMGAAELGYYSRGWKLLDLFVAAVITPLQRVLLPKFATHRNEPRKLRSQFTRALDLIVPPLAVLSALFVIHAPAIVQVALGSQWGATIPVAQVLFAALVPRCAFKISETFAVAVGKSASAFYRVSVYAVLMLTGAILGSFYGIDFVALGVTAAVTGFYILSLQYVVKLGGVTVPALLLIHLRAAVVAALVAGVDLGFLWLGSSLPLLVRHALAGGAAILVGVVLGILALPLWLSAPNSALIKSLLIHRVLGPLKSCSFGIVR